MNRNQRRAQQCVRLMADRAELDKLRAFVADHPDLDAVEIVPKGTLAALRDILDLAVRYGVEEHCDGNIIDARAIIAKATGE